MDIKVYLLFGINLFNQNAFAENCLFDRGTFYEDVVLGQKFHVSKKAMVPYPVELFESDRIQLTDLSREVCRQTGILKLHLIHKKTSQEFTAYYTDQDECDGGSAVGVIVSGRLPDPVNAVAVIRDSELSCL
jgi:hypothetical protein